MPPRAAQLIERLRLRPHPEGGHYAEVFRSAQTVDLRDGRTARAALTSIYFLLCAGEVSRWHRVASDELWCHLEGAPLELHCLEAADAGVRSVLLGPVGDGGVQPQWTVPAGQWQAARSRGEHSLVACAVAPGFDFVDFELMAAHDPLRERLQQRHPGLAGY
jgi:predicted cupin superfamily sugar epimerase